jgi:hypothetical protein
VLQLKYGEWVRTARQRVGWGREVWGIGNLTSLVSGHFIFRTRWLMLSGQAI